MRTKTVHIILAGIIILFTVLLRIYLQQTQQFIFHYREQHQLFLFDYDSLKTTLTSTGGLAHICAMFLVQFFSEGSWGALITACCGSLIGLFLWLGVKRLLNVPFYCLPLCFIPPLLQISALADTYYSYASLTAMLFVSILFFIVSLFKRPTLRIIAFIVAVACMVYIVYQPEGYYEPLLEAPSYCKWPWFSLVVLVIPWLTRFLPKMGKVLKPFLGIVLMLLIVASFHVLTTKRIDPNNYKFMELNSYVINNEWDKVIDACNHTSLNNTLYMNYLNLALSHKGTLLLQLFHYPQRDAGSLLCEYQKIPDVIQLQSFIYYQMGDVAAAQNTAFSASVCNRLGSPSALQMLVKTNLAYGAYEVAEKYIAQLEKTWKYKDWASHYRSLLSDKQALNEDKEITNLRKSLTKEDHFAVALGVMTDLDYIVEANPDNRAAFDYLVSMLLLSKDNVSIRYFVDKYTNTPVLAQVPELLQEAIYSIAEQEPDYLRAHGVSEEVFKKYDDFYNKYMQSRNARRNPATDLRREYGHSFWYYLMFNK
ncbi:MAG: putative sulfate/molybdate transporter [Bacteroidaceae bacterium]|nr:putative sulfate/molybdate transporter [Bacteroidaceae bacterium]